MAHLTDVCKGRWPGLLPLFGVEKKYLTGRHCPCPMCGGVDRWRFDDKGGRGTWYCNKCGNGDGFALVMRLKGFDFTEAQEAVKALVGHVGVVISREERGIAALQDARDRLWRQAEMLSSDDLVSHYLERRGIVPRAFPSDLRYLERCLYQDKSHPDRPQWLHAMLARVTAPDGKPAQLHRTYLDSVGFKAKVENPRRLMPGPMVKGSAIRLGAVQDGKLGIAEGIETALSASQLFGVPVWAAISSRMMLMWQPPEEAREIIIYADNDTNYDGQSAAFALAHRLSAMREPPVVHVQVPPRPGTDWNDELLRVDQ